MNTHHRHIGFAALLATIVVAAPALHAQISSWKSAVDAELGRSGAIQPDTTYKIGFPRSDLAVTVGSVKLMPALALGSWVAFLPVGPTQALVMGDLVLTESEIGLVMSALQGAGVDQTALHNHLRGESPHVMYMHIMARGNPARIARGIRTALDVTGIPQPAAAPSAPPTAVELDTAGIARALGRAGKLNGAVYQISVPRAESIRADGVVIPPSMGVATAINIQPTGGGRAVATGDFVLLATEVNRVIRALRSGGIEVTALHSHMLDESPRLFFMHFWASEDAVTIARGLRSALDLTNSRRAH